MGPEAAAGTMLASELAPPVMLSGLGGAAGAAPVALSAASAAQTLPAFIEAAGPLSFLKSISPESMALQGASAGLNFLNESNALSRKKALADAMAEYGRTNAGKQTKIAEGYVDSLSPTNQTADLQAGHDIAAAGLNKAVGANMTEPTNISGKLSGDYKTAAATAADSVSTRNAKLIESLSKIAAPTIAGNKRAIDYGQAAGSMSALEGARQNVNTAFGTDMQNQVPNPYVSLLAQGASGVGKGLMLRDALKTMRGEGVVA